MYKPKSGKTTLKNHRTISDETNTVRGWAKKSAKKMKEFEESHDMVIIPIHKGSVHTTLANYENKKETYDNMATGKIRTIKAKKK